MEPLRRAREAGGQLAPVRALTAVYARRPFLTAWLLLALAMGLAVLLLGRDVGLTAGQHGALVALCLPLALLCTWIVFLETGPDEAEPGEQGDSLRWAVSRVSLVIPTYNGAHLLPPCLDSISRQTRPADETLVVDDASTDDTPALLSRRYPWVRTVRHATNRGFAGAVNTGIGAGSGEIVVLLNNDTEADPHWLEALVRPLETEPQVGFCASKLLLFDRRDHLHSAGDGYTRGGVPVNRGAWQRDDGRFDGAVEVFGACAGRPRTAGSCWKTWGASTSGCTPTWRTSTSPGGPSCGGIAAATSPRRGSITRSAPRPAGCAPATTAGATSSSSWPATSPPLSCAATGGRCCASKGRSSSKPAATSGSRRRGPASPATWPGWPVSPTPCAGGDGCRAPAAPPWSVWRPSSPRRAPEGP